MPLTPNRSPLTLGALATIAAAGLAFAQTQAPGTTRPAGPTPTKHHARVQMLADSKSIVPGQPFTVALLFRIEPKWHLYWKDPGDSGLPPSVKWKLPAGFTAGELQFPKPEVLKTKAGTNYVYHDQVALLVQVTPDASLRLGETLTLEAEVKWLECTEEMCLPARQDVSAPLTVSTAAQPNEEGQFAGWRAKVKEGETFDPKTANAE